MADVLLIGIGITTYSALESLLPNCNIQGIVRNIDLDSEEHDPVVKLARQADIPIFSNTSQQHIKSLLLKLQPDCVVVSSYNQILPSDLIVLSAFVNVHYSPLPTYRGRANVNWAIINNEPCTAVTIHQISPDLDAGNILFQKLIPIHAHSTVDELYQQLNEIQKQHLGETVVRLLSGDEGVPQVQAKATHCCTRLPEDGEIDWSASTQSIDRLIRALVSPFPGAYTYFQGKKLIIWRAQPVEPAPVYVGRIPGRVVARSKQTGFVDVLTGEGVLRIFEVQFEGDEKTVPTTIIRSVKSTLGLRTTDLLNHIQRLEREILELKKQCKTVESSSLAEPG